MLSDVEIREAIAQGYIKVDPMPEDVDIQPASIDVHVGGRWGLLIKPRNSTGNADRPVRLTAKSEVRYVESKQLVMRPGDFALGQLAERVTLNAQYGARVEGKSSNGRKGLAIHVTAGFVDPGWDGYLTVELFNASPITYIIEEGDPIGQLSFDRLAKAAERPYGHKELGSHYQGSENVRASE